ncbi:molybdate ABC transporter substrate-binding protein [Acetivibrio cellulolyticus]|uniref:molybdate ABC transporter substrate-binding protein n=1 Tax=Acetivibrio cellulolyticus TaxID=35830 RepID=UPI0001E2BDAB|nr:molybdate ABC transporter substrate-binding protein [Acetivibrio cellulolyticus]
MKKIVVLAALTVGLLLWVFLESGTSPDKEDKQEITVFAASSLTESFEEIKSVYEMNNESIKINLNFAGSQALKTSLENGGKADIFVSANLKYMDELRDEGFINQYKVFLRNRLILVKNMNSTFSVEDLKDLSNDGISLAVGDKSVPVGSYWQKVLDSSVEDGLISPGIKAKIDSNIKTRELNVKDVLSKVLLGEVDFGVVYKSDITKGNEGKLEEIDLDAFSKCEADYPLAILKNSEKNTEVQKFYNFLISKEGKDILKKYKFITD